MFKNTVTFFLHSSADALLKSARWTAASIVSIHCTVVISPTSVWGTVSNCALEETFTTFACADSIMFPGRFVPTNSAVEFISFRLYSWKIWNRAGISARSHFWLVAASNDFEFSPQINMHWDLVWKPSRFSGGHSCIQFFLIIYSTMARSSHKLSECQIFIVKGRQGCQMKERPGSVPAALPVTPFRV